MSTGHIGYGSGGPQSATTCVRVASDTPPVRNLAGLAAPTGRATVCTAAAGATACAVCHRSRWQHSQAPCTDCRIHLPRIRPRDQGQLGSHRLSSDNVACGDKAAPTPWLRHDTDRPSTRWRQEERLLMRRPRQAAEHSQQYSRYRGGRAPAVAEACMSS